MAFDLYNGDVPWFRNQYDVQRTTRSIVSLWPLPILCNPCPYKPPDLLYTFQNKRTIYVSIKLHDHRKNDHNHGRLMRHWPVPLTIILNTLTCESIVCAWSSDQQLEQCACHVVMVYLQVMSFTYDSPAPFGDLNNSPPLYTIVDRYEYPSIVYYLIFHEASHSVYCTLRLPSKQGVGRTRTCSFNPFDWMSTASSDIMKCLVSQTTWFY